jgi:hypothetical protein
MCGSKWFGRPGFDYWRGHDFLLTIMWISSVATKHPINGRCFILRTSTRRCHSSLSSAEAKNAGSLTFTPQYVFMACCLNTAIIIPYLHISTLNKRATNVRLTNLYLRNDSHGANSFRTIYLRLI